MCFDGALYIPGAAMVPVLLVYSSTVETAHLLSCTAAVVADREP